MEIKSSDSAFSYTGRIDYSEENPIFIYPGTMAEIGFTGTMVSVNVENELMGVYTAFGALVDGVQYKLELAGDRERHNYKIAENLPEGEHTLVIFKRQAAHHYLRFCSIELDEGAKVFKLEKNPLLKIEVYGDSVSAGEVTEAMYYEAHIDPENHNGYYDNSWFSYPLMLGRLLNAEVHDNSQGGIALLDKTGFFCGPDKETLRGMINTYDKLSYVPYSSKGLTDWDFSLFTPDLVIIAIGQNDPNPDQSVADSPEFITNWKAVYKQMIQSLKAKHGEKTRFLLTLTVLMHDPRWNDFVRSVAEEIGDDSVRYFEFSRCGKATPGHPKITEQQEMAVELDHYIRDWFKL